MGRRTAKELRKEHLDARKALHNGFKNPISDRASRTVGNGDIAIGKGELFKYATHLVPEQDLVEDAIEMGMM